MTDPATNHDSTINSNSGELDRRALLGVVGLAGVAALAARQAQGAGPLVPPAGAVAGTGRTLDEVYNKIPAVGGGDGRTPIPAGGALTISTPGSYVLTGNISAVGGPPGITISANNVLLDLNGFTVTTSNSNVDAITLTGTRSNVWIRNGIVIGGMAGVGAAGNCTDIAVSDLRILNTRRCGILIAFTGNSGIHISRCLICNTGVLSVAADSFISIAGITIAGGSCTVADCRIDRVVSANPAVPRRGIDCLFVVGTMISGNTITSNGLVPNNGTGIWGAAAGSSAVFRNNTVHNFTDAYGETAGWVNGGGNV